MTQYHYTTWPDFGVPSSPSTFLAFLFEIRNAGAFSKDVGPSVIHCRFVFISIIVDNLLRRYECFTEK